MKSAPGKIIGWLFALLGVLVVIFGDYIHGHWPVTIFFTEDRRVLWATYATIAISVIGVLLCSAGMWLLSTWAYLHRVYWIAFVASLVFVWCFIWWILGRWDILMTTGTILCWWVQNYLAAAFLILALLIPARARHIVFGITSVFYLVACMILLAFSLCTQNNKWEPRTVSLSNTAPEPIAH